MHFVVACSWRELEMFSVVSRALVFTIVMALAFKVEFSAGYRSDFELVYLDTKPSHHYTIDVFDRNIHLQLKPNNLLLSNHSQIVFYDGNERTVDLRVTSPCHYLHSDTWTSAALSFCDDGYVTGLVFLEDSTLEIQPTPSRMKRKWTSKDNNQALHIIKRATIPFSVGLFSSDSVSRLPDISNMETENPTETLERTHRSDQKLTLETALFFDEAGYKLFSPYFGNDDNKLKNMLLAYLNGVQALYHHPSLGLPLDISLVRLEVMKVQPTDLPHYYGEREALLDSFCAFNAKHNPPSDKDPSHWDIGLYISGLDFYAVENGRRSDVTMGLSAVGGVCTEKYSCVIAEFGTTNALGKPYPSAGFTSVYVLAHEIGHNLGMHHDSVSNNCPRDGFIMSPSRSVIGETEWSVCSAQIMEQLRSSKCLADSPGLNLMKQMKGDTPGVFWGSKRQCELLLRDGDATAINSATKEVCANLECETPHRTGRYFAGPALDGTSCESGKWCIEGKCEKRKGKLQKVIEGGWSKWNTEKCRSGCTLKSKGFQKRHRTCDNPRPINTDDGCIGPTVEVNLCNDEQVCHGRKRLAVKDLATKKCKEFAKTLKEVDSKQPGLQAPHETARLWVACSVFCHRKDSRAFYTPRLEFNDLNIDPFLPDGTWCHNDGNNDYYCQQHNCLPENHQLTKSSGYVEDLKKLVENALPDEKSHTNHDHLLKYFSLDEDGKPVLKDLPEVPFFQTKEDEWSIKDYIDLVQPVEVEELENFLDVEK